ncbi:unnamed protein product [Rotaria magnacalcarata]
MEFRFIRILLLIFIWVPFVASYYECDQRLVLCGCGLKNVEMNVHIANGEDAIPYSWPMIVSLRYDCLNNGNVSTHCCSGTILSASYILTAAHCVENINESSLLLVDQIFIHPNWTAHVNGFRNDIAILHLTESLDFSTNLLIARTRLPSQSNSTNDITKYPPSNSSLVVIGWNFRTTLNSTARDILQQATLISIHHNHSSCAASINHIETQFCAGRYEDCKGTCVGDSGGPILRWIGDRWEQVGIVSYGLDNCESANHQMIFTRITAYYDWIERVMNQWNSTAITTAATATATAITTINRPLSVYRCSKNNTLCGCGFNNVALTTTRIVGGEEAIPYSWSMIVSLRYDCLNNGNFTTHCCGGTILNSYYILTAAHCVDKINLSSVLSQNITIAAGIHNLTEINQTIRRVDQIFIHSEYAGQQDLFKNDIAILHLSEPLDLDTNPFITQTCRPLRMNSSENIMAYPSNGSRLAVVGWSAANRPANIIPQLLQQLYIRTIHHNDSTCARSIGHVTVQFCGGVYDGGKGICYGDSGGPIFEWLGDR